MVNFQYILLATEWKMFFRYTDKNVLVIYIKLFSLTSLKVIKKLHLT